jgi:AraC-like DNA-binding protein
VVDYKYRLGEFYMKFGDYHRAEQYCRYVVKAPMENAIQEIFIQSRNSLGIIYRDYYHNLDESDRWFRSIIDFQKRYGIVDREQQWLAVANGNIGRNSLLRGQPAKAIPLMLASFRVLYSSRNYVYTYTIASALTDAYCQTNQFDKALRFLKITRLCADSIHDPLAINMFNYYKSACKYYAATKNGTLSGRYFDSAFLADKVYQRRFDESRFLQVEQKQSHLEWETQNEKARANYRSFLHAAVISVVIFCLLVICVVLYVRKRKAYRLLACKTQEWGGRQDPYTQPQTDLPEPEKPAENPVTMSILEYMEHSKCYLQNDLTLDSLARNLGMNRTYLSNAIHDIDINFNALVNKYRIQQAVKILAEEKNINLEELAYKVGFNNRKSFYNAFTAITGLSPTQFRRKLCTPCH